MPISIHLLIFSPPDFSIALKVRRTPPRRAGAAGEERERLGRELSRRLPPHLVRDVLTD